MLSFFVILLFAWPACGDLGCETLTGYYYGTFARKGLKDEIFNAQFQVKLHADATNRLITGSIDKINSTYTPPGIYLHFYESSEAT